MISITIKRVYLLFISLVRRLIGVMRHSLVEYEPNISSRLMNKIVIAVVSVSS